jgi:hypothetical protein
MIVETLRALRGDSLPEGTSPLPLPARVRELIAHRLERLGDRSRRLLAVAAVIGRPFDFGLLQRATDLGEAEVAEGVEELVRHRVLHGSGESLELTHDRIREVVYGQLVPRAPRAAAPPGGGGARGFPDGPDPRRRGASRGRWAGRGPPVRRTIARPREPSGRRGDEARALHLLGEIASRREPSEGEQALENYAAALVIAEGLGMAPLQARCRLGRGGVYQRMGQDEEAQGELTSAMAMLQALQMRHWLQRCEALIASSGRAVNTGMVERGDAG